MLQVGESPLYVVLQRMAWIHTSAGVDLPLYMPWLPPIVVSGWMCATVWCVCGSVRSLPGLGEEKEEEEEEEEEERSLFERSHTHSPLAACTTIQVLTPPPPPPSHTHHHCPGTGHPASIPPAHRGK
jgi:hypothetical protein